MSIIVTGILSEHADVIDVPSSHTSPVHPGAQRHRRSCEQVAPFLQGGSQTAILYKLETKKIKIKWKLHQKLTFVTERPCVAAGTSTDTRSSAATTIQTSRLAHSYN